MQANFIKKESLAHRYFPVKFAKFLRTLFFTEHVRMTASVSNFKEKIFDLVLTVAFLSDEFFPEIFLRNMHRII